MRESKPIIIAIDGPAASGKSTTAREVAKKLGYIYIDSGAMYRAVTLKALENGVPVMNEEKVAELAEKINIKFDKNHEKTIIFIDDRDVSEEIRKPSVDREISPIAANPKVRKIMVRKQREMARDGGVVMDGRDIGTVVIPEAELKIFMLASSQERAVRRQKELEEKGIKIDLNKIIEDVKYRDLQDETRSHGPLKKAPDAIVIDTTKLSIPEQIEKILELAQEIIKC
jgi:cytidylate kinase